MHVLISSLVLSGEWVVGDIFNSKDLASEVYKNKFQYYEQLKLGERESLLEYQRSIERKAAAQTSGTQIDEIEQEKKLLQDINAELQKKLDVKQNNEQQLRRQSKAFIYELKDMEKEKQIAEGKLQWYQQQLQEKDIIFRRKEKKRFKESRNFAKKKKELEKELHQLHHKLAKAQEEFAKKEKELSELQQLHHSTNEVLAKAKKEFYQLRRSKKEELAKTKKEFKHQLEEKEQIIQKYSHMLQVNKKELEECQDALRTQKQKDNSIIQATQCNTETANNATQVVQEGIIYNELI